jgi:ankyrin repeat protein
MKKLKIIICLLLVVAITMNAQDEGVQDRQKIKDALFAAAEKGDFETVKNLLTKYPDMKNIDRNDGFTLLHMANKSKEMIEYLIKIGLDIEAKSGALWTPLHSQAYKGNLDGVELLLKHGADIEAKTSFGMTPLLSSLRWDRIGVAKFLIEKGANINLTTELGRTPLIVSAVEGNSEQARLLLDNDANVSFKDNNYQRTALHFAALYGQFDIVDALVKKGADVNEKDASGRTALDYACRYGHKKVAKLLKSSGAEGEIDPKNFGFSPYLTKNLKDGEAYAWYMGDAGYAVKTKNHFLLFNYSYGSGAGNPLEPRLVNGRINIDEIADCHTIIFAGSPHHSHHHPEIFSKWQKTHKNITFVYSFQDKLGRNPNYFIDVEGPKYIYLPDGEKKAIQGVTVETIPVISPHGSPESGFLIEADRVVIFYGGEHLLFQESQKQAFSKPIDTLKERGIKIDLLILPGNFSYGRIFPVNLEGVDYAVKTLKPKAFLASGGDSTEFVLVEVAAVLEKYKDQTKIFCPEHRGDMFSLKDFPKLTGPYLGQKPPGMTPEIFAPGIISLVDFVDFKGSFSPDGSEYYFYRLSHPSDELIPTIFFTRVENGAWIEPVPLQLSQGVRAFHPCVSSDNKWLFFLWQFGPDQNQPSGIYASARTDTGWSAPKYAGQGMYLTCDNSGRFYTTQSVWGDQPKHYLAEVTFSNGMFTKYERLKINPHYENQTHPCIAPEGSYIIFDIEVENGSLFVSFKDKEGHWGEAIDLTQHGFKPDIRGAYISPDGKYLFYSYNGDIWWVDIKVIEQLRPKEF